jgi:hypothetical protein
MSASEQTIAITDLTLAFLAGRVLLAKQLLDDARGAKMPVLRDVDGLTRLQTRLREELDNAVHAWLISSGQASHHDTDISVRISMSEGGTLDLSATIRRRAHQG